MGGVIAPGSDIFAQTAQLLYEYYAEHINLPADDKLEMFTTESTAVVLPDVRAGRLADGYRASFLVFGDKPFESNTWTKPELVYVNGELAADNRTDSGS
jgi:predicted amidohydrolase YtcJ